MFCREIERRRGLKEGGANGGWRVHGLIEQEHYYEAGLQE